MTGNKLNIHIVGGQDYIDEKGNMEVPPTKAKSSQKLNDMINSGLFNEIVAKTNTVKLDKNGKVVERIDKATGKLLTGKARRIEAGMDR